MPVFKSPGAARYAALRRTGRHQAILAPSPGMRVGNLARRFEETVANGTPRWILGLPAGAAHRGRGVPLGHRVRPPMPAGAAGGHGVPTLAEWGARARSTLPRTLARIGNGGPPGRCLGRESGRVG